MNGDIIGLYQNMANGSKQAAGRHDRASSPTPGSSARRAKPARHPGEGKESSPFSQEMCGVEHAAHITV
jgi:hypothetical protein